ncbi:MAG: hypothetical protein F6K58_08080 [Symploca sp. SIO2E9]|nr:hypothetical protein [Symploca sp. SIO2E9]
MANPDLLPSQLQAQFYPSQPQGPFPEMTNPRYQPGSEHPFGVCFSGGGMRSFSASLGQMRGLNSLGLLDTVGAISCVSGGTWFGALASYAPTSTDDTVLLGPVIPPEQLTLDNVSEIDQRNIASPLPRITNITISALLTSLYFQYKLGKLPLNRIYSRIIGGLLLEPFSLNSSDTYFSLDADSVNSIVERNPDLTKSNFYTIRPNRPYFIAGATQIYPLGTNKTMRLFEYSSLYVGTPQLFPKIGPQAQDFGGGFLESFAFDSDTPSQVNSNYATVVTPEPPFLLSDLMGSSGAAPAIIFAIINEPDYFPEFCYWPVQNVGTEAATSYSFADGGSLENTGIVSLLYRQYPVILAFVNTSTPLGSTDPLNAYEGVTEQITRLFGFKPENPGFNTQDTQIFPSDKFQALADGLKAAKAQGKPTYFKDTYTIKPNNTFDIPPYPGNGEVTIVWFYNDINQEWKNKISDSGVKELLESNNPENFFGNFPNYKTTFQNKSDLGIPEILKLTPQQVNLLAHMTCYTVINAEEMLKSLSCSI